MGDMMTKQRITDLERSHQALEDEIACSPPDFLVAAAAATLPRGEQRGSKGKEAPDAARRGSARGAPPSGIRGDAAGRVGMPCAREGGALSLEPRKNVSEVALHMMREGSSPEGPRRLRLGEQSE
jgi:hypothetical protein